VQSKVPTSRSALFAAITVFLPIVARADGGNWLLFGIYVFVVPTVLFLIVACLVVWFVCPPRVRPLAIALCVVPCTPIYNGTFAWPLWVYSIDRNLPGTVFDVTWRVILTALTAYLAVQLLVWLRYRAKSPPDRTLERTREN
jgi:hypothetical protein